MRESALFVLVLCLIVPAGCENRPGTEPGGAPKAAVTPTDPAPAPTDPAPAPAPAGAATKAEAAATPTSGAGAAPISAAIQPGAAAGAMVRTPSGLEYEVLKQGEGPSPPLGSRVTVHFAGFVDGRKFRDTREAGVPREFKLDRGNLIEGWVEALLTMKKGEQRKLKVPSRLAYGRQGYPGLVPSEKDVTFELELVTFLPPSAGPGR